MARAEIFVFFTFLSSEANMVPGPWLPVTSVFWMHGFCCCCFFIFSRDIGAVVCNSRDLPYVVGDLYLVLCIYILTLYCLLSNRAIKSHKDHCPIMYSLLVLVDLPAGWLWHIHQKGTAIWFHTGRLLSFGPWQLPKTATLSRTGKYVTDKIRKILRPKWQPHHTTCMCSKIKEIWIQGNLFSVTRTYL